MLTRGENQIKKIRSGWEGDIGNSKMGTGLEYIKTSTVRFNSTAENSYEIRRMNCYAVAICKQSSGKCRKFNFEKYRHGLITENVRYLQGYKKIYKKMVHV